MNRAGNKKAPTGNPVEADGFVALARPEPKNSKGPGVAGPAAHEVDLKIDSDHRTKGNARPNPEEASSRAGTAERI